MQQTYKLSPFIFLYPRFSHFFFFSLSRIKKIWSWLYCNMNRPVKWHEQIIALSFVALSEFSSLSISVIYVDMNLYFSKNTHTDVTWSFGTAVTWSSGICKNCLKDTHTHTHTHSRTHTHTHTHANTYSRPQADNAETWSSGTAFTRFVCMAHTHIHTLKHTQYIVTPAASKCHRARGNTHTHTHIYIYIHVYTYIGIFMCARVSNRICQSIHMHTYIHTNTHPHIYIHIYTYIHTYIHVYVHVRPIAFVWVARTHRHTESHKHTHTEIYMHTNIHIHVYIYIHICV